MARLDIGGETTVGEAIHVSGTLVKCLQWSGICALSLGLIACVTNDPRRDAGLAWDGKAAYPRPDACTSLYLQTDQQIWKELRNDQTSDASRKLLLASLKVCDGTVAAPMIAESGATIATRK